MFFPSLPHPHHNAWLLQEKLTPFVLPIAGTWVTMRQDLTMQVPIMFEFKINLTRNAILCVLKGQFDAKEASEYVVRWKEACDQMQPGFTIISDLREFAPAKDEAKEILQDGIQYAIDKGRGRAFRIVTENVGSQIGNLQLNRTARKLGYEVDVVASMDEVARVMGWD
jgi:hypothetical protein